MGARFEQLLQGKHMALQTQTAACLVNTAPFQSAGSGMRSVSFRSLVYVVRARTAHGGPGAVTRSHLFVVG